MKRTKQEKGITLVALIITIIVLLILAVVTIAAITGDGDLISHANNAKTKYMDEAENENTIVQNYLAKMPEESENGSKTIIDDLSATTSYVGYYADVDSDGTPDGVIFVDLMKGANNNQATVNGTWNNNSDSTYSYTTIETSKAYSVTTTNYTGNTHFGEHPIISIKSGSTGNDRFYVMALNNIDSNYYWNKKYLSNNYSIGADYLESSSTTQVAMQTSDGESIGKRNTGILMQSSDLTENTNNLWSKISTQVSNGWFVPSRAEWSAFGDFMWTKLGCSTSNYSTFELSGYYWSSSQSNTNSAWRVSINYGFIYNGNVGGNNVSYTCGINVRLAVTF